MGVPFDQTKPRFEEDLKLLEALLTQEEVSWNSPRYSFEDLTIMPRPEDPIPLMVAVMNPAGIEAAAKAGYHVQTTPLGGSHQQLMDQVNAFRRGKAAAAARSTRASACSAACSWCTARRTAGTSPSAPTPTTRASTMCSAGAGILDHGHRSPAAPQANAG